MEFQPEPRKPFSFLAFPIPLTGSCSTTRNNVRFYIELTHKCYCWLVWQRCPAVFISVELLQEVLDSKTSTRRGSFLLSSSHFNLQVRRDKLLLLHDYVQGSRPTWQALARKIVRVAVFLNGYELLRFPVSHRFHLLHRIKYSLDQVAHSKPFATGSKAFEWVGIPCKFHLDTSCFGTVTPWMNWDEEGGLGKNQTRIGHLREREKWEKKHLICKINWIFHKETLETPTTLMEQKTTNEFIVRTSFTLTLWVFFQREHRKEKKRRRR